MQHSWDNGLNRNTKKKIMACRKNIIIARESTKTEVNQYTKDGEFIKKWDFISDVEHTLNIDGSAISKCCRGKRKTAGGYRWSYPGQKLAIK